MSPIFSQRFLRHLFSQPAVLQVTALLLNLAGVAHVVDAASAGYTKFVQISTVSLLTLWTLPLIGTRGRWNRTRFHVVSGTLLGVPTATDRLSRLISLQSYRKRRALEALRGALYKSTTATPDLWLTCDHFVGKASAMGQPTRPTQPPTLSGTRNE